MLRIALILITTVCATASMAAPRTVLGEIITNTECGYCPAADHELDILQETYGESLALIRYHGWWPGSQDPFWLFNQEDSRARILYLYAHQANPGDPLYAPHVFFDGHFDAGSNNSQYEAIFLQALNTPSILDLGLEVDLDFENELIHVTCDGVPEQPISGDLFLRFAVTESDLYTSSGTGPYHQVMRDMVPTPEGIALDLSSGEVFQDQRTIPINSAFVLHNLQIVAFVQNDANAEVFQTVRATMPSDLPLFHIGGIQVVESGQGGDGDGVVNPGEEGTISFFLTADPSWGSATDLTLTLTTQSEYVTILAGETTLGQIASGDTVWIAQGAFVVAVSPQAGMGLFPMELIVDASWGESQPYQQKLPFGLLVSMNQFGFPMAASGEIMSSPVIFDVDGRGKHVAVGDEAGYVHVVDGDGIALAGFPVQAGSRVSSSPAIADLDGNGVPEIIVGSWDKNLYCFAMDGAIRWVTDLEGYVTGPAAVGDVDGDGAPEVVAGTMSGDLWVLDADGSSKQGWPADLGGPQRMSAGICLVDMDDDGAREIVVGTWGKEVHAYRGDGTAVPGWPVSLPDMIKGGVVAAPLAGENLALLVPCNDSKLYILTASGSELASIELEGELLATPALSDLDGDGMVEIVVVSANGHVHVLNSFLTERAGWPVDMESRVETSPAIADIDGDGSAEILLGSEVGLLKVFTSAGELFLAPLDLGARIRSTPGLADMDGDGDMELMVGAGNALVGLDFKNASSSVDGLWSQYRAVPERTGWLLDLGVLSSPVASLPTELNLCSPFPNPGSFRTTVRFELPTSGYAELNMYDVSGRKVRVLAREPMEAGFHSMNLPLNDLPNGVYFIGLTAGSQAAQRPLVVIH